MVNILKPTHRNRQLTILLFFGVYIILPHLNSTSSDDLTNNNKMERKKLFFEEPLISIVFI